MLNCTVDVEPKHEVFHEKNKKKCKNPDCQCYFTPNKYNPHQEYCSRSECKKYCDKLRQRNYYRNKIRDPVWHESLMARKKNERQKRYSAQKNNTSQARPPDSATPYTARGTPALLLGMLSFFTGASDREELALMEKKCLQRGMNLNLNHPVEKKNKDFLTLVLLLFSTRDGSVYCFIKRYEYSTGRCIHILSFTAEKRSAIGDAATHDQSFLVWPRQPAKLALYGL